MAEPRTADVMTAARDDILASLRASIQGADRLFRDGATPDPPVPPSPVTSAVGDPRALAEQFGARLEAVLGAAEIVERDDVVARSIALIRSWTGAATPGTPTRVLSWDADDLPVPRLEAALAAAGITLLTPDDLRDRGQRGDAAAATVGLTGVEAAFAGTGSFAVTPAAGRSRSASLLPSHHLVLVPFSRIHPTIESWMLGLRRDGALPSFVRRCRQLVFVTGPSKSADIELSLTLGVHGPGAVHAVVFNDLT